ncbi:MAG TPA: T9SS type A sorting domain-containing protein [Flavobacteriales bacterium]|nr:T9SS type A sorting domain-containing protein [Flavobacteriales bacterium]
MKNFIRVCTLFTLLITKGSTQITITDADLPTVNDTFRLSTAIDSWSTDPTPTGTNFFWDYSFLVAGGQDLDTCVSVSSTPFAYQFFFNNAFVYPDWKASYAVAGQGFNVSTIMTVSDVYDYFKVQSSKWENVGFGANINGVPTSIRKNPIELKCNLPLDYNDTYSNYSSFVINVPGVGEYRQKMWKDAIVDGWGKVGLPIDTFDVLRLKIIVDITDSIYIESFGISYENPRPTEIQYHYMALGQDVPVLQVNATTTGTVSQFIYKDVPHTFPGVKENTQPSFIIFPNPASNNVTIRCETLIEQLDVCDLSGRTVYTSTIDANNAIIPVNSSWDKGIYFVRLVTDKGISTEKLVIEK